MTDSGAKEERSTKAGPGGEPGAAMSEGARVFVAEGSTRVACDGVSDSDPLGHPRVFLSFAPGQDTLVCPYCSRLFVRTG